MGISLNKFDYRLIYNNQNPKILEGICKKHNCIFGFDFFEYLLINGKDIPNDLLLPLLKYERIEDLNLIPKLLIEYNRDIPDFVLSYISKRGDASYKTCRVYIKKGKVPPDIILRSMITNITPMYNWDSDWGKNFMKFLDGYMPNGLPVKSENSIIDITKNKIREIENEDTEKTYSQESFSFKSYFMR